MSHTEQPSHAESHGVANFIVQMSAWPTSVLLPGLTRTFTRFSSRLAPRVILAFCVVPLLIYTLMPFYDIRSIYSMSIKLPGRPKNAFAVLLGPNTKSNANQTDMDSDNYFIGTRVLNYQIQHSLSTRYTDGHAPFIVLVTPEVAQNKRDQLTKDGATVIPVENIVVDWISAGIGSGAWGSVLAKLQLWTLTEYERIVCLDSDTLLIESLNGIFDDPAAQQLTSDLTLEENNNTSPTPLTYTFGGIMEGVSGDRAKPVNAGYLNAGFFLLQPSLAMYEYYLSLMAIPDRFNPSMPEQNLFNYAHRGGGPMPWQHLDEKWNTNCPSYKDVEMGWKTVHGKHWETKFRQDSQGWDGRCATDPVLGTMWWRVRGHMEAYYRGLAV